jgi:hypothetical protein
VTQEQLDAMADQLAARTQALRTIDEQLKTIAADPENPAPEVPPVVDGGTTEEATTEG